MPHGTASLAGVYHETCQGSKINFAPQSPKGGGGRHIPAPPLVAPTTLIMQHQAYVHANITTRSKMKAVQIRGGYRGGGTIQLCNNQISQKTRLKYIKITLKVDLIKILYPPPVQIQGLYGLLASGSKGLKRKMGLIRSK